MGRTWEDYDPEGHLTDLRNEARRIHDANLVQPPRRPKLPKPDPDASDLDKAIATAVELRGLISDAHGATKDLRAALAEYRQFLTKAEHTIDSVMERTVNLAISQWTNWLQEEQNKHAANLNTAVEEARGQIVRSLTLAELKFSRIDDDNQVHFLFTGLPRPFDEHVPAPHPEAGMPKRPV